MANRERGRWPTELALPARRCSLPNWTPVRAALVGSNRDWNYEHDLEYQRFPDKELMHPAEAL